MSSKMSTSDVILIEDNMLQGRLICENVESDADKSDNITTAVRELVAQRMTLVPVVWRSPETSLEDDIDCHTVDGALPAWSVALKVQTLLAFNVDTMWVVGGANIYQAFIGIADVITLTRVNAVVFKGDSTVKFPFITGDYEIASVGDLQVHADTQGWEAGAPHLFHHRTVEYTRIAKQNAREGEEAYMALLNEVMTEGALRSDRTGTGTLSVFARQLRFDISKSVPVLTTKNVAWKAVIKELLWFMKGHTDSAELSAQGVHIWKGNSSRSFLNSRGLVHLPEGDIGAGYGFQWRHFGATYKTCHDDYGGEGVDQLAEVIRLLKTDPTSRRIFMSAWNPAAMKDMALPPCHVSAQFFVDDNAASLGEGGTPKRRLSCHMYQRSVDCFLGLPFNIFSYTVLTYILAAWCDMDPHELIISTGDTHIYSNHVEQVRAQLSRKPLAKPVLIVNERVKNKRIHELELDDFELVEYQHHPKISAVMSV